MKHIGRMETITRSARDPHGASGFPLNARKLAGCGNTTKQHLNLVRGDYEIRSGPSSNIGVLFPSMHETLSEDETFTYLASASRVLQQTAAPAAFSSRWTGRSKSECAPQHPDPFSHVLATGSPPPIAQLQMNALRMG